MSKSINVELDDDMSDALDKVHPSHRNTAINLGVKLLTETDIYSSFFMKSEHRSTDEEGGDKKLSLSSETTSSSTSSTSSPSKEAVVEDAPVADKPKVDWDNF